MTDLRESVARAVRDEAEYETTGYDDRHICNWPDIASAALRAVADAGFVIVKGSELASLAGEPDLDKRIRILARMAGVDHLLRSEKDMEELRYGLTEHARAALAAAFKTMGR